MKRLSRKGYLFTGLILAAFFMLSLMSTPAQARVTASGKNVLSLTLDINGTLDATTKYDFGDVYAGDRIPDVTDLGLVIRYGDEDNTADNACISTKTMAAEIAIAKWVKENNVSADALLKALGNGDAKKTNTAFTKTGLQWYECTDENYHNSKELELTEESAFEGGKYYYFTIYVDPGKLAITSGTGKQARTLEY